jgi:hypothetical protein
MVWKFIGAQKKKIAYLVWLESNTQLFGFEFGLLGAPNLAFRWRSISKKKSVSVLN